MHNVRAQSADETPPALGAQPLNEFPPLAPSLPAALLRPSAYPHAVDEATLVETHISWVFLAGSFAYKVKKPVRLDFLDFSTIDRRRESCQDELRVNSRFAGELYLGLSRVTRSTSGVMEIDGRGETVDWAVRMRRFDRSEELDVLIDRADVDLEAVVALGGYLAGKHADAPAADQHASWCTPDRPMTAVRNTLRDLGERWPAACGRLDVLGRRLEVRWTAVASMQRRRRSEGLFRECHGDLHCGNIVRLHGRLLPFDALEFDRSLSWIDPVNDLAFLLMDLDARGRRDLAAAALDGWLQVSGDFEGLAPLDLFQSCRALVRALVNAVAATQGSDGPQASAARERYLAAAERFAVSRQPSLILVAGLSGSGKSWLASRLLAPLAAIRVRSDVERKRLAGLRARDTSDGTIYTAQLTERTYARLADAAASILQSGHDAIVDAACLRRAERAALRDLARIRQVPFRLVWVTAPEPLQAARIESRLAARDDPSEATVDVLRAQRRFAEIPDDAEMSGGLWLDTDGRIDVDAVAAALQNG